VGKAQPTAGQRWRCAACGNLTRFDVTRTCRVVEFVHLDLAGEARVEDRRVLSDVVERVRCRWCDRDDAIEVIERPDAATAHEQPVARPAASGAAGGGERASR
jgi:hypothetical protein